jgi:hypothetical protein
LAARQETAGVPFSLVDCALCLAGLLAVSPLALLALALRPAARRAPRAEVVDLEEARRRRAA